MAETWPWAWRTDSRPPLHLTHRLQSLPQLCRPCWHPPLMAPALLSWPARPPLRHLRTGRAQWSLPPADWPAVIQAVPPAFHTCIALLCSSVKSAAGDQHTNQACCCSVPSWLTASVGTSSYVIRCQQSYSMHRRPSDELLLGVCCYRHL